MHFGQFSAGELVLLVQHELLLFAAVFFAIGALDELAIDLTYLWLRVTGRGATPIVAEAELGATPLAGPAAVFVPTWQEAAVIGPTIMHALESWPHAELTIYVGCYRNDVATMASVLVAARGDGRVRLVIHGADGPTCKADCLNRLYAALCEDEARSGRRAHMVVLHDAEDMVDPAALTLLDRALWHADFVQLPVLALPQRGSRWIAGHYSDEFAEAHGKALVVRDALGAGLPGAGVGSAIARKALADLDRQGDGRGPFSRHSLTEDYEFGMRVAAQGGRTRFLRVRTGDGRLIATRAFFPADFDSAVRQKTRWTHGIALQSWDRLGWGRSPFDLWMQLRDRRGPFGAILLSTGYVLLMMSAAIGLADLFGWIEVLAPSPLLMTLLQLNFALLAWRAAMRGAFTAREFGWREGVLAPLRIPVSNIIAILAAKRALTAYVGTLRGAPVVWDKTEHLDHPALVRTTEARA